MRKTLTRFSAALALVLLYSSSFGQVFFTQDFEGAMNATTDLPANWTESGLSTDGIWSTDNAATASSPYLVWPAPNNGSIFAYTNDDECNCNKSNDRMFLPVQNFSTYAGVNLRFDLYLNGGYSEMGFVIVSTNGGTSYDTVYTAVGNATAWQNNVSVNLNAYAGAPAVRIGFIYNDAAGWAYAMGIDDVVLTELQSLEDLKAVTAVGEYTLLPLPLVTAMPLSASVANLGVSNGTDVRVTSNVYSSTNGYTTPLFTATSTNTIVNAGDTVVINSGTYTPTVAAGYIYEHIVSSALLIDGDASNDTVTYAFEVTSLEYARDDSMPTIGLGVGAGTRATLGNNYSFPVATSLAKITFALNAVAIGDTANVTIYNTDVSGMPTTVHTAIPYIVTVAPPGVQTINFPSGLNLAPGTYFFGVQEAVTVANYGFQGTNSIFTPRTSWGSIGGGPWGTIEALGFPVTFVIRPHLAPPCTNSSSSAAVAICDGDVYTIGSSSYTMAGIYVDTLIVPGGCDSVVTTTLTVNSLPTVNFSGLASAYCDTSATSTLTGTPAGGTFSGPGISGSMFDPAAAGAGTHNIVYTFTDGSGCSNADTSMTMVTICVGLEAGIFANVQVSPNPSHGNFVVAGLQAGMDMRMYDMQGKLVMSKIASVNEERFSMTSLPAGMYFLKIAFEGNVTQVKVVIE